jgi:hypothetical protein
MPLAGHALEGGTTEAGGGTTEVAQVIPSTVVYRMDQADEHSGVGAPGVLDLGNPQSATGGGQVRRAFMRGAHARVLLLLSPRAGLAVVHHRGQQ